MKHFLDTGILLAASYVWNTEYHDFDPTTISPRSKDTEALIKSNHDNIVCVHVRRELLNLQRRRHIAHDIITLELFKPDSDDLQTCYELLAADRSVQSTRRDRDWMRDTKLTLSKYPPADVFQALHDLRLVFDRNIKDLLDRMEVFSIIEQQRLTRDTIRRRLRSIPGGPNNDDTIIYANAAIYHNQEHTITVFTLDQTFAILNDPTAAQDLTNANFITSFPAITVL